MSSLPIWESSTRVTALGLEELSALTLTRWVTDLILSWAFITDASLFWLLALTFTLWQNTQRQYATLLALQNELVDNVLRPGKTGAEVYEAAVDFVKKKDAKLAESLPKNLGFAVSTLSIFTQRADEFRLTLSLSMFPNFASDWSRIPWLDILDLFEEQQTFESKHGDLFGSWILRSTRRRSKA